MNFEEQWAKPFSSGPWRAIMHPTERHWLVQAEIACVVGLPSWFSLAVVRIPDEYEGNMTGDTLTPDVARANAQLMAAAPDLLEACMNFVAKVDAGLARSQHSYGEIKAAVNKALGNG
jgi:hypothetical protein